MLPIRSAPQHARIGRHRPASARRLCARSCPCAHPLNAPDRRLLLGHLLSPVSPLALPKGAMPPRKRPPLRWSAFTSGMRGCRSRGLISGGSALAGGHNAAGVGAVERAGPGIDERRRAPCAQRKRASPSPHAPSVRPRSAHAASGRSARNHPALAGVVALRLSHSGQDGEHQLRHAVAGDVASQVDHVQADAAPLHGAHDIERV